MDEQTWLTERFEEHRPRLRGVAYRMLGSLSEAEDAVQEAWLRLSRSAGPAVENLGGWLTTVVSRVCLDMLRSRQSRREEPFTPDAPEPVATGRMKRTALSDCAIPTCGRAAPTTPNASAARLPSTCRRDAAWGGVRSASACSHVA